MKWLLGMILLMTTDYKALKEGGRLIINIANVKLNEPFIEQV